MNDLTSPMGREWLGHLPSFYEDNKEFRLLAEAEGEELDGLVKAIEAGFDQRFVDSATWGLARWERELGIKPSAGQPYDQRRSVIRSKLRGTGTVTARLIKSVAEAYANGEVEVIEDNAVYKVSISFISTLGVPLNLADLEQAIRNVLPAHLVVKYVFRFLTWNEITFTSKPWDAWDALELTWNEMEVYKV
ncbi:putative phage tail protein [Paenibacillus sp. YIM B09110]|uniref:putative phage tail protein n=1 Tax=Paenibacillus sp. YIM B09110 TaxID=3126102 RepID=UPI00301DF070